MADTWKSMKAGDAISGKEGTVYATINGEVIGVAECKNINAKITKKKNEFKSLGHRGSQYKATGWSGSGTLTIHYATSRWAKLMINYANKGIDTYFKIDITNEDPTSSIGKQVVTLIDCNLDEAEVAKIDVESEFLDQSMNFTFSDIAIPEEFSALS